MSKSEAGADDKRSGEVRDTRDLLREARDELTNDGSAHEGGDYDETCSVCILIADIDATLASPSAEQPRYLVEDNKRLRLFIADTARLLRKEQYADADNRAGLAIDCEMVAGEEMRLVYLDVRWQTERAIKAEKERDALLADRLSARSSEGASIAMRDSVKHILADYDDEKIDSNEVADRLTALPSEVRSEDEEKIIRSILSVVAHDMRDAAEKDLRDLLAGHYADRSATKRTD